MTEKKIYLAPKVICKEIFPNKHIAYDFPGSMSMSFGNAKESEGFDMEEDINEEETNDEKAKLFKSFY